jgi:hypothetical protein
MNHKSLLFTLLTSILFINVKAQSYSINGRISDASDKMYLPGVSITLIHIPDTSKKSNTISNSDGTYTFEGLVNGYYIVKYNYLGYNTYIKRVGISDKNELLNVQLTSKTEKLKDVNIDAKQIRVELKGDTIQYNAAAYKTHKDASVEDLVTKMPGVTNENGTVKAQGEQVQKVLLDGKEFFGDDPSMSLRNLPAEMVDKIQVFDRMSDQARFTGVDDGNAQKTINITSKRGKTEGQFGKFYGGLGYLNNPADIFNSGLNYNYFKGERRVSVLGFSNNINQQNFSMQDLMGVMGGGMGGGNRGGGGGMRGMGGNMPPGAANYMMQSSGLGNFMVNQQNGIATSHAIGINYTDEWSKQVKVTGSYFFNQINNKSISDLKRTYFNSKDSGIVYNENSPINNSINTNNRINFRLEYNPDSNNAVILSPRLSFQNFSSNSITNASNSVAGKVISLTDNTNTAESDGYSFKNEILYRHKFLKYGRTISFTYGTDINDKWGYSKLVSNSQFSNSGIDTSIFNNQNSTQNTFGYTHSGNISYTEPLGKYSQIQISYSPSYNYNESDRTTKNYNIVDSSYSLLNSNLSNKYNFDYTVQRGGLSYVFNYKNTNLTATVNAQQSHLQGTQQFPNEFKTEKYFDNILPQLQLNHKFSSSTNLRFNYRTSANAPSISQLQTVVNNSNPVLLTTGNSNLRQDYTHFAMARFGHTNMTKGTSLFMFLNGQMTQDYIANQTFLPTSFDTIDNIVVKRGSQLTKPINIDGYWNARAYLLYGFPIKFIKSNINLNAGVSYSRTPGLINNLTNYANTYNLNQGLTIASNVSEKLDFTISYNSTYNIVENTIQKGANNNYFNHTAGLKLNYVLFKKIVFNTNITQTLFTGLSQGYNQNFTLCNASIAYKFLKSQALEAKLSVYDLLNQNNNVSRNVTETYVEDTRSNILKQYFMITLTYSLRKFRM